MDRRPTSGPPDGPAEFAPFYGRYVALVDGPVLDVLRAQPDVLGRLLTGAPGGSGPDPDAAYAPGKWTVHEALRHVVDAERVFAYRALHVARGDAAALPSFDEDAWAAAADVSGRPFAETVAEFRAVRASTVALFEGLPAGAWDRAGVVGGHPMSVRALAYVIAGHAAHHVAVLRERYGLG